MGKKATIVLISVFFSIFMIALFYVKDKIAPNAKKDTYRFCVMVFIAILNLIIMSFYNALTPIHIFGPFKTAFLFIFTTVALFTGPIVQNFFHFRRNENKSKDKEEFRKKWIKRKINHFPYIEVVVAPFIEEFLYRYCNGNLWISADISQPCVIFCSPLIFGLAHFHHFFENFNKNTWLNNLITCIVQVGFTSLFGFWTQFCWVKTHGLLTCIILHGFCNYMQFPDFAGAINWSEPTERRQLHAAYIFGIIMFCILTVVLAKM